MHCTIFIYYDLGSYLDVTRKTKYEEKEFLDEESGDDEEDFVEYLDDEYEEDNSIEGDSPS